MTERMHETERIKDSGNQRQGELDKRRTTNNSGSQ